jgi:peptidoglycan/xylan/chitin deacetylase (PgdA/CDA1 family)
MEDRWGKWLDSGEGVVDRRCGVLAVSIDVELAWGVFDLPDYGEFVPAIAQTRAIVADLLVLFRRHDVRATWAIVGHLFLEECHRVDGTIHPEVIRPRHPWFPHDWFRDDPGVNRSAAPLWYGADLVSAIQQATPAQEIGLHSYCHMLYGDPGCSREAAASDLGEARRAAQAFGIEPVSFVFPRDLPGHLDLLAVHGFLCYRGQPSWWFRRLPTRLLIQSGHLVDDLLGLAPPTVMARVEDSGLVNIPGSMLFRHAKGIRRMIPVASRIRKARAGIRRAIQRQEIFHLHFHPWNFGWNRGRLMGALSRILEGAVRERDAGRLDILTMGEVARRTLAAEHAQRELSNIEQGISNIESGEGGNLNSSARAGRPR